MAWDVVDSIHLAQDRNQRRTPLNIVINTGVQCKERNFLTSSVIINFSSRILLHGFSSYDVETEFLNTCLHTKRLNTWAYLYI